MSSQDILARVRRVIGDMCPLGARDVAADDRIMDDLGYDSMGVIELALVLESEFELAAIDEEQAIDLVTVGDVADLVAQMVSART
ncbi:MAG TPA: phosphopantetheine-binding protein [Streptosporangiaceae bacterium]|nr:phosphopantetheine-binding protein [Streptosporangiaceae bacterium]